MENALTKVFIYGILFIVGGALLKIGNVYLLHKLAKEKAYANFKKKDKEALQQKKIKQQMELEEILLRKDVEPYYTIAKDLFHDAIQASNLNHEQILYLKKIINESLGDFIADYKCTHYKNDAHEIYSKLKSSHISINSFKKIIQLIKSFEAQKEGIYLTIAEPRRDKTK